MRFLIDASMSPVVVQELRTAGHDAEGQGRLELTSYRAAITDVFAFATFDDVGYVHYRDAWAWRHDVEAVLDDLDGLLESGFGVEVVALADLAMVELNGSVGHVDDSDGHLCDLFERTMALHLAACRQAPPDRDVLAEKLFRWRFTSSSTATSARSVTTRRCSATTGWPPTGPWPRSTGQTCRR
jgi:hypothetical protein